jgi:hypothetical protein
MRPGAAARGFKIHTLIANFEQSRTVGLGAAERLRAWIDGAVLKSLTHASHQAATVDADAFARLCSNLLSAGWRWRRSSKRSVWTRRTLRNALGCFTSTNHTGSLSILENPSYFAVNVLPNGQQPASRRFGTRGIDDRFADVS